MCNKDKEYTVSYATKDSIEETNQITLQEATILALQGKLTENIEGQLEIDENGLPKLERPYSLRSRNDGRFQITSSHPYDLTDYSWAYSVNLDPNGDWVIIDPDKNTKDVVHGWNDAIERMKEIDSKKQRRIDRT